MRPIDVDAGRARAQRGADADVAIGIVVDNRDPLHLGRVRVALPVVSEHDATAWAPVASPGAGPSCGWFFVPEVGDEVVVAFEHGDIDRPIVLGALWNGRDLPPFEAGPDAPACAIVSRAGHRITFDDAGGKLVLEDGGGNARITLDTGAGTVAIEALQGDVCISAEAGTLRVSAARLEISAGRDVLLHAAGEVKLAAGQTVEVSGHAASVTGVPLELG